MSAEGAQHCRSCPGASSAHDTLGDITAALTTHVMAAYPKKEETAHVLRAYRSALTEKLLLVDTLAVINASFLAHHPGLPAYLIFFVPVLHDRARIFSSAPRITNVPDVGVKADGPDGTIVPLGLGDPRLLKIADVDEPFTVAC
jgi:hypothetical protein